MIVGSSTGLADETGFLYHLNQKGPNPCPRDEVNTAATTREADPMRICMANNMIPSQNYTQTVFVALSEPALTSTRGQRPLPLTQHAEDKWNALRQPISNLYIKQCNTLSHVMMKMEAEYGFKASKKMYKKRLAEWKFWKNKPGRPSSQQVFRNKQQNLRDGLRGVPASSSPRNLRQNDCDEEMHTALDYVKPYVKQICSSLAKTIISKEFANANYMFDTFTHSISEALGLFSKSEHRRGGTTLRHAFISLERLFSEHNLFTLPRVFYALAGLTTSGFFEIAQILLAHSHSLAVMKIERFHPLVQILKQFASLSRRDNSFLEHAVFKTWRCLNALMNEDCTNAIALHLARKSFWQDSQNWLAQHHVIQNLRLFLEHSEKSFGADHEVPLVALNELLAIYSQLGHPELEVTASDLLSRVNRRIQAGSTSREFVQWRHDANWELAWFFYNNGKIATAIEHMRQVVYSEVDSSWELYRPNMLAEWSREEETLCRECRKAMDIDELRG